MEHSRCLLNSPQVVRLSNVTVSVANADREYGATLFYRFNVSDRIRGCVRAAEPQPTEWQRIGNKIDAAFVFSQDFLTGHHFRLGPRRASVAALRSHRNHGLHGNTEWREARLVAKLPLVLWEKTQQFQREATTQQRRPNSVNLSQQPRERAARHRETGSQAREPQQTVRT